MSGLVPVFDFDFVFDFVFVFFFFQAEDGIRDRFTWLEFRRVLFRSPCWMKNYTKSNFAMIGIHLWMAQGFICGKLLSPISPVRELVDIQIVMDQVPVWRPSHTTTETAQIPSLKAPQRVFWKILLWKALPVYKTVEIVKKVVVCMDKNCIFIVSVVVLDGFEQLFFVFFEWFSDFHSRKIHET